MGYVENFKPEDYPSRVQWEYATEEVGELPSRQYAREIARRIPPRQWGSEDYCCPHPHGDWPVWRTATWRIAVAVTAKAVLDDQPRTPRTVVLPSTWKSRPHPAAEKPPQHETWRDRDALL